LISLEERLLEVQNPARTLVACIVATFLPDCIGRRGIPTSVPGLDPNSARHTFIGRVSCQHPISVRGHVLEFSRDFIAEPIDVVLEDEVIYLAGVTGTHAMNPILEA